MKCIICGYTLQPKEGYLTRVPHNDLFPLDYRGKKAHCGCFRQMYLARKKTFEMLKELDK